MVCWPPFTVDLRSRALYFITLAPFMQLSFRTVFCKTVSVLSALHKHLISETIIYSVATLTFFPANAIPNVNYPLSKASGIAVALFQNINNSILFHFEIISQLINLSQGLICKLIKSFITWFIFALHDFCLFTKGLNIFCRCGCQEPLLPVPALFS